MVICTNYFFVPNLTKSYKDYKKRTKEPSPNKEKVLKKQIDKVNDCFCSLHTTTYGRNAHPRENACISIYYFFFKRLPLNKA